jgi:VIT1/CCC1 family predicted Fe2+/Mn2+ transporter
LNQEQLANPLQAASASALAFVLGAVLPLLAILLPPPSLRIPVTFAAVLVALGVAGAISARIGGSDVRRAVLRVVFGGAAGRVCCVERARAIIGVREKRRSHSQCEFAECCCQAELW